MLPIHRLMDMSCFHLLAALSFNKRFLSTYYDPATMLDTCSLSSIEPSKLLSTGWKLLLHFTDKGTEAQQGLRNFAEIKSSISSSAQQMLAVCLQDARPHARLRRTEVISTVPVCRVTDIPRQTPDRFGIITHFYTYQ